MGVFLLLVIRAQNFFGLLGLLRRRLRLGLLPSSGIYCLPERKKTRGREPQQVRPISIFTELTLLFDKNRTSFMQEAFGRTKEKIPPEALGRKRCALINKVFRSPSHPLLPRHNSLGSETNCGPGQKPVTGSLWCKRPIFFLCYARQWRTIAANIIITCLWRVLIKK